MFCLWLTMQNNVFFNPNGVNNHHAQKAKNALDFLNYIHSIGYDSLNNLFSSFTPPGVFSNASSNEIKLIFAQLKKIAREYAPEKLKYVTDMEKIAISNANNEISDRDALIKMRNLTISNGGNTNDIAHVENIINQLEVRNMIMNPTIRVVGNDKHVGDMPQVHPLNLPLQQGHIKVKENVKNTDKNKKIFDPLSLPIIPNRNDLKNNGKERNANNINPLSLPLIPHQNNNVKNMAKNKKINVKNNVDENMNRPHLMLPMINIPMFRKPVNGNRKRGR